MTLEVFRRLNVGDKVKTYSKHPKARYDGVVCVVIDKIEEKKPENYRNRGLVLLKPIEGQLWTHKDQHPWGEGKFNDTIVSPVMRVYDAKFITLISKKVKVRRAP